MKTSHPQPEVIGLTTVERFLLGRIEGWDLPRPWFDIWLHGRLSLQRELEDAQDEARRLGALDARPAPRDVSGLLRPSFAATCRLRGEDERAVRAERRRGSAA